jgi:hypothetical protein
MGGFGSTRWNGILVRQQADSSFMLCAPSERRARGVMESTRGVYAWPKHGYLACYELYRYGGGAAMSLRHPGGVQVLDLEPTPANLGGVRWWWLCPNCGRRCGKLYLPPRRHLFKCRVCYQLSYESAQASRASYYQLYKAYALKGLCTATVIREGIREGLGGYTVAPLVGILLVSDETKHSATRPCLKGV